MKFDPENLIIIPAFALVAALGTTLLLAVGIGIYHVVLLIPYGPIVFLSVFFILLSMGIIGAIDEYIGVNPFRRKG